MKHKSLFRRLFEAVFGAPVPITPQRKLPDFMQRHIEAQENGLGGIFRP